jgi:hypothetical protein
VTNLRGLPATFSCKIGRSLFVVNVAPPRDAAPDTLYARGARGTIAKLQKQAMAAAIAIPAAIDTGVPV